MAFQGDSIFWVEVEKIVPNPYQPRREFNEDKLKELAESVRMYGILQPLTVTRKEIQREDGAFYTEYELIAGERRLRASKLAGLIQVPVIIRDNDDTEQEKLELAIIENLQREDLNAVDRAMAFQQLASAFNLTHDQVAKKVGRSRMYVSNTIRLLGLPEHMLESLKLGDISEGHARTLLMLKDRPEEQEVVFREVLLKKLSVREVERIVRKIATDKVRKKNWKGTDPHLIEIEKKFTDALGTRVQIAKTDYGGKVTIDYFSEDELQKLLSALKSEEQPKSDSVVENIEAPVVRTMEQVTAATPLEMVGEAEDEFETDFAKDALLQETPAVEDEFVPPVPAVVTEVQTAPTTVEEEENLSNPFADVLAEVGEEMSSEEGEVLEAIGAINNTPRELTPEERVAQSSSTRAEVEQQISALIEKEESFTPIVPPAAPVAPADVNVTDHLAVDNQPKQDDESDLYSMNNFSI